MKLPVILIRKGTSFPVAPVLKDQGTSLRYPAFLVTVSLHYLQNMPAFNSHMRQNAFNRNLNI